MLVSFRLEILVILTEDSCMVCAKRAIGSKNHFGRTRWYSSVTRLKWKLDSGRLETVLILTQDWCTFCAERTIDSEIVLDAPD
jgi:hypothetical protein